MMRHHDSAFMQFEYEIWENPERDQALSPDNNPRVQELQAYLASSFLNILINEPPFNAVERFKGISLEEYDQHCLEIARERFQQIIDETNSDKHP